MGQRYISLVAWDKVTKPKRNGGLGIKNLHHFNLALLAKMVWQWVQVRRPQWMQLIRLENQAKRPWDLSNATVFWRNLRGALTIFYDSIVFRLGKGTHISFWEDNWMNGTIKEAYLLLYVASEGKKHDGATGKAPRALEPTADQLDHV